MLDFLYKNMSPEKQIKPEKIGYTRRFVNMTLPPLLAGLVTGAIDSVFLKKIRVARLENMSQEGPLEKIKKYKNKFSTDLKTFSRADTQVKGIDLEKQVISRQQFVFNHFMMATPKRMSQTFQYKMALAMPGLVAQESGYDGDVKSSAGAVGLVQVMPNLLEDINKIIKRRGGGQREFAMVDMKNMERATEFLFQVMDEIFYKEVAQPAKRIAKEYGLDEDKAENFGVYCVMNAYNTGPTRMRNVLAKFVKNYPAKDVVANFSYGPLSLFDAVTSWGYKEKQVIGFGKNSSEYVLKSLAWSEVLGYENLDKTLLERNLGSKIHLAAEDLGKIAGVGAGTALAADVALRTRLDRRMLFQTVIGGAAGIVGSGVASGEIDLTKFVPKNLTWWQNE